MEKEHLLLQMYKRNNENGRMDWGKDGLFSTMTQKWMTLRINLWGLRWRTVWNIPKHKVEETLWTQQQWPLWMRELIKCQVKLFPGLYYIL